MCRICRIRRFVLVAGHADPVRTLSVVVPRVTRVRLFVIMPATEAPLLLRPVLAEDDPAAA